MTTIFSKLFDYCLTIDGLQTGGGHPASEHPYNERRCEFKIGRSRISIYSLALDEKDLGVTIVATRERYSSNDYDTFAKAKARLDRVIRQARDDIESYKRGEVERKAYDAKRRIALASLIVAFPMLEVNTDCECGVIYRGWNIGLNYSATTNTLSVSAHVFDRWISIEASKLVALIDVIEWGKS